jgi:hypothetical protein
MNGRVQMLDTLQTVNRLLKYGFILGSGMSSLKISITDLFSSFGYNEVKVFVCVLVVERILGRMIHGVFKPILLMDLMMISLNTDSGKMMVDKKKSHFVSRE